MSNQINVDPQGVISGYQNRLADMTHEAMVAQAAVNQLSTDNSALRDQLQQREAEIARLTQVPDNGEVATPTAQWGNMDSTQQ